MTRGPAAAPPPDGRVHPGQHHAGQAAAAPGDPDLPGPGRHRAVGADRAAGRRTGCGQAGAAAAVWAFPWAGGQALARYLLDHPGQVRGRTVLDFAAGSGLVAIRPPGRAPRRSGPARPTRWPSRPSSSTRRSTGSRWTRRWATCWTARRPRWTWCWRATCSTSGASPGGCCPGWPGCGRRASRVLVGDPGRAYLPPDLGTEVAAYQVPVPRALEDADGQAEHGLAASLSWPAPAGGGTQAGRAGPVPAPLLVTAAAISVRSLSSRTRSAAASQPSTC